MVGLLVGVQLHADQVPRMFEVPPCREIMFDADQIHQFAGHEIDDVLTGMHVEPRSRAR